DRSCPGVYSLDCEMCYTVHGLELSRVTVVNSSLEVVYDTFVKPENEVIDYNTSSLKIVLHYFKDGKDFLLYDTYDEDDGMNTSENLRHVVTRRSSIRHVIERLWRARPVGGLVEHLEPRYQTGISSLRKLSQREVKQVCKFISGCL
uniref:Uncharacterized protein n=1 Tax=Neolamprologus brichardi TaxID=32507 RepID=A0A3Q4I8L1_NEOBR